MNLARLLLFWLFWYLAFSTRTIVSPLLPLIQHELTLSQATAAGLYLFMAAGSTIAVALAGFIASRVGYKRMLLISFGALTLFAAGLSMARGYLHFALLLFGLGACAGFYLPCAVPMITAIFERRHWGKAIALHETAAGFSLLSLPFIIAYLLIAMPWRSIFLLLAAIVAAATLLFWVLMPAPAAMHNAGGHFASLLRRADFWIIMALWVICGMTSMGVYNVVPLYLVNEKAMALEQANRLFSLTRIGGFAGQILIGFFLDRFRTRTIVYVLTVASGVFTIGLAVAKTPWLLATMLQLQGTFCVVFFPVGIVAISKLTELEQRSLFTGTIMCVSAVMGIGVTPFLLGAIADRWSFQAGFMVLGLLTLVISPLTGMLRKI